MSANEVKPSARTLVIIPTYNEEENLPLIVERVQAAQPNVHILVVDDNSPDGTGKLADKLAAENEGSIFVMHREGKGGLGGAYIAGFHWGLERDYTVLCEMDADGSHAPEQLCRLLDRIDEGADMVLGSRYVPGGTVVNWPKKREILSRGGNIYTRIVLGAKLNDITGGYRATVVRFWRPLTSTQWALSATASRLTSLGAQFRLGSPLSRYPSPSQSEKSVNQR